MTSPRSRAAFLGATAALAAGAVPALAASSPTLDAHSIFAGGKGLHVGAIAEAGAHHAKITKLCVSPAPIDRPDCSASKVFSPSKAGQVTLTATFADGSTTTKTLPVAKAATKLDRGFAVEGYTHCSPTVIYGQYNRKTHKLARKLGEMPTGSHVALYNRIGNGRLAWSYKANTNGFVKASCLQRATK